VTYREAFDSTGNRRQEQFWTPVRVALCTVYFACMVMFTLIAGGVL
jgi:hypothetical protein